MSTYVKGWQKAVVYAVGVAMILSIVATSRDWIVNPSGIFHSDSGTDMSLVFATFASWIVPALIVTVLLAVVITISINLVRRSQSTDSAD